MESVAKLLRPLVLALMAVFAIGLCPAPCLAADGGLSVGSAGDAAEDIVPDWNDNAQGTAYVSVSNDARYLTSDGDLAGEVMAYVPIDAADVAAWAASDAYAQIVEANGLEKYHREAPAAAGYNYELTVMQLLYYVAQRYSAGGAAAIEVSGGPGSVYIEGGFFGGTDNLNYFVDGVFPLEADGVTGATCDEILLADGMFVDVAMFTNRSFYQDPVAGLHYFMGADGKPVHAYAAGAGAPRKVSLARIYGGLETGSESSDYVPEAGWTIYWGTAEDWAAYAMGAPTWHATAVTGDDGCASITFPAAGTYYLWADGGKGSASATANAIVSSPAYAVVHVAERTDIAGAQVTVCGSRFTYTGAPIEPEVSVELGGKVLVQGEDFSIGYSGNVEVGTATVTATGINAYKGMATATFQIAPAPTPAPVKTSIAGATVTAASQTWTGRALKPAVTVKLAGKVLAKGTDYTVAYSGNKAVGTAKITVIGIGSFEGTASGTFKIKKAAGKLVVTAKAATAKKALSASSKKATKLAASQYVKIKKKTGTVTYAKANAAGGKRIVVAKNGRITVKKGCKKGTYTVKVKLTAKASATHKAASQTVKVKIKVK